MEHGETFEQCAKREVAEETGLEVEDVRFLTAVENFFEEKGGEHYVTLFLTCALKSGDEELMEPKVC